MVSVTDLRALLTDSKRPRPVGHARYPHKDLLLAIAIFLRRAIATFNHDPVGLCNPWLFLFFLFQSAEKVVVFHGADQIVFHRKCENTNMSSLDAAAISAPVAASETMTCDSGT
jgi:hypothetical protein